MRTKTKLKELASEFWLVVAESDRGRVAAAGGIEPVEEASQKLRGREALHQRNLECVAWHSSALFRGKAVARLLPEVREAEECLARSCEGASGCSTATKKAERQTRAGTATSAAMLTC